MERAQVTEFHVHQEWDQVGGQYSFISSPSSSPSPSSQAPALESRFSRLATEVQTLKETLMVREESLAGAVKYLKAVTGDFLTVQLSSLVREVQALKEIQETLTLKVQDLPTGYPVPYPTTSSPLPPPPTSSPLPYPTTSSPPCEHHQLPP